LRGLYLIYGLNAFALVPHMVFFADFVARGLGQGLGVATRYWVLYGIGAVAGPLIAGRAADRWGECGTLMTMLIIQFVFVALPALDSSPVALIASSLVVGACTIGIVPVVLGRTREILRHHHSAHFSAWRTATGSFALLQAIGAYGMSFVYQWSQGSYAMLFASGAGALALAIAIGLLTQRAGEA
jgi:predicted MFS family arabinose efflux permease